MEKYENGNTKAEKIPIVSDTISYLFKSHYPNGILKSEYYLKDTLIHGPAKDFFQNGKIEVEGGWHLGMKKGWFKFYDSASEKLTKIIEYIPFRDSSLSKPNQIIRFAPTGDTIKDGLSVYYEYYATKDTIKLNKETYTFKIVLAGHKFKYAYIGFCNFDERFRLHDAEPCPVTDMDNYSIELNPREYHLGENKVEGYIVNMENPLTSGGKIDGTYIEIYFSKKFYVVP